MNPCSLGKHLCMGRRQPPGHRPEDWDLRPEELAEVGYEDDGIMWLTVTPETATPEQALAHFAEGSRGGERGG